VEVKGDGMRAVMLDEVEELLKDDGGGVIVVALGRGFALDFGGKPCP
jgi:hypothetical protein